jgi:hypothetical protein
MSTDGLSTIEGVADFLATEVVPAVGHQLRGEVRAAVKLLRTAAVELAVRHREIGEEIRELLDLCVPLVDAEQRRVLARLADRVGAQVLDLREQEALRLELHAVVGTVMSGLVRTDPAAVSALVDALGRHASRRSTWQAVFTEGVPA